MLSCLRIAAPAVESYELLEKLRPLGALDDGTLPARAELPGVPEE
jgi:hypothetical protein